MSWVAIFAVFLVAHLVGDFLLQTEWQALNKHGGLRHWANTRALTSHVATYAIPFVPAMVWVSHHHSATATAAATVIALGTHFVQDDGELLVWYVRVVKKTQAPFGTPLWMAIDQSFHVAFLFAAALVAAAG